MSENQAHINVTKYFKDINETFANIDKNKNKNSINVSKYLQTKESLPVENIKEIVRKLSDKIENLEGYNSEGSLARESNNSGAMAYAPWMNKYGAKKGPKFPPIDNPEGRELYTAVFPNSKAGRDALEERVEDLYKETGGDLESFASIYALGYKPDQLIDDRQQEIKNRYFKAFSSTLTDKSANVIIKRRENDIGTAVLEETSRIKNSNNIYSSSILNSDIFSPTRFQPSSEALRKMQEAKISTTNVDRLKESDISYNKRIESLLPKVDVVVPDFIEDYDNDDKVNPIESYVQKAEKRIRYGDDASVIANKKWTKYFSEAIGEEPSTQSLKGLASSWMRDVGQIVIGQVDFINKAHNAFNSSAPFLITRIDESGKSYTSQEEFSELFVSTLAAMPEIARKIYIGTKATTEPGFSTEEAKEAREFILQNPASIALFGFGLKSMMPVKGFPKPKIDTKLKDFMDRSEKIIKTANDIKKGIIKPEEVAPSVSKIAEFIEHPDIIDATLKRSIQNIYNPKKIKSLSNRQLKIVKDELPNLIKNFADNEIRLLSRNLTEQQILSLNKSKQALSNLIGESISKVGAENTIVYLEGSTGIPKALAKKIVESLKKVKEGNIKIPDNLLNLISRKIPVKKAKDIDKNYSPEYRQSQVKLEKNNAKTIEAKIKNKETFLKNTKAFIAEQVNPRYKATSILNKIKKRFKGEDLQLVLREVQSRLIVTNGATHVAKNKLNQINKNIYDNLNINEINLLNEAIIYKSNISLRKYNETVKIPELQERLAGAKKTSEKTKLKKEIKERENYGYTGGKETASKAVFREWELDKLGGDINLKNKINDLSDLYFDVFKEINDYKYKAGIITKSQYKSLNLRDYSPTRYLEFLEDSYKITDSTGKTISYKNNQEVSSLGKGITDDLTRITDSHSLISQALLGAENAVFRNNAVKALSTLVEEINKIDPKFAINKIGKNVSSNNIKIKKGYKRISYKKDGKERFIDLDADFADGWTQTGHISVQGPLYRTFEMLSGVRLRKLFSTNVDWAFALKDNVRNIQYAMLRQHDAYSSFLPRAYIQMSGDIIKNFRDVWHERGAVQRYIDHGGGMEFLAQQSGYKGNFFTENPKGYKAKLRRVTEMMQHLNSTTEVASRVAVMQRLEGKGWSTLDAVAKARDIIDFSVKGDAMKLIEPLSPYTSAGIRATYGLFEGIRDNPKIAAWKYAQTAMISGSMYYFMNRNTDRKKDYYDNDVSEYDKFNNHVIVSPFEVYDDLGKKRRIHWTIPKDNGGKVVGAATETAFELAEGKPFTEFRKERLLKALGEMQPVDFQGMPLGFKLILGWIFNQKSVAGMPSAKTEGTSPDARNEKTDSFFRRMGDYTNISSDDLQYTFDEITGYGNPITNGLVDAADAFLNAVDPDTAELYNKEATKLLGIPDPLPTRFINTFTNDFIKFGKEGISEEQRSEVYNEEKELKAIKGDNNVKIDRFSFLVSKFAKSGDRENKELYYNQFLEYVGNTKLEGETQRLIDRYNKNANIEDADLINGFIGHLLSIPDPRIRAVAYHHELTRTSYSAEDRIEMNKQAKTIPGFATEEFKATFNAHMLETKEYIDTENVFYKPELLFEDK
tara:strand:+ start:836 stop:5647 length:4812 start_codon:yes stop_codon:yes gene_type:complete